LGSRLYYIRGCSELAVAQYGKQSQEAAGIEMFGTPAWFLLLALVWSITEGGSGEMIVNRAGSVAISSLGWIDHGSLWVLSASTGKIEHVPISDASFLQLFVGGDDLFAVQHSWGNDWKKMNRIDLTAHSFTHPDMALARIVLDADRETFEGDSTAWASVPRAYVGALDGHYYLFLISVTKPTPPELVPVIVAGVTCAEQVQLNANATAEKVIVNLREASASRNCCASATVSSPSS
jgi:hypothetical protein